MAEHRIVDNREFFQIDIDEAVMIIEEAIKDVNDDEDVAQQAYLERMKAQIKNKVKIKKPLTEKQKEANKNKYKMNKDKIQERIKLSRKL